MYNLSLPKLCATLLVDPTTAAGESTGECTLTTDFALYCAVPYIAACVDVSRTCFGTVQQAEIRYV